MLNRNPGWNQKSYVIGYQMQVRPFGRFIPSDETIPVFYLPGSACPSQTRDNLVIDICYVSDMFTNKPGIAEVVVVIQEGTQRYFSRRPFTTRIVRVPYSVIVPPSSLLMKRGV